jgi:hypothetical protein
VKQARGLSQPEKRIGLEAAILGINRRWEAVHRSLLENK